VPPDTLNHRCARASILAIRTVTPARFPIAEHGSWNRSAKIGYRVTVVSIDANGRAISYEPFAEGWLQGQQAWGRPTDVAVAPDGSLLVADDAAGAIYRIRYRRP
jgi:glucose/arabinose dehydrogenase